MSKWTLRMFAVLVALWLVAPTLVVVPLSFTGQQSFAFPPSSWSTRWYQNFFQDPRWISSLVNSLEIALITAIIATAIGAGAAMSLSRTTFPGQRALMVVLMGPMFLPIIIFAVGVYAVFLELGLIGTLAGFVVAHTVIAIPFVVATMVAALRRYDPVIERGAAICGASRTRILLTITLPSIAPSLISAFMFAFVVSFDEVMIGIFLSDSRVQTLPVLLFASSQRTIDPTIGAAATLIMVLSTVLITIALLLHQRRGPHAT